MQKKLIALAIAGLASSAAFAQTNVQIYGIMDMGVANVKADGRSSGWKIDNGLLSGSRLGFKGEEDLGGGLKAVFNVEYMLMPDVNSALGSAGDWSGTATRQAFVGLKGNWGTVVGGRLQGAGYNFACSHNPVAGGAFDTISKLTAPGVTGGAVAGTPGGELTLGCGSNGRYNNAVAYLSPNWNGFTFEVNHARLTENANRRFYTGTTAAIATPVSLTGSAYGTDPAYGADDSYANLIRGNYTNGPFSASLVWAGVEGGKNNSATGANLGAAQPADTDEWGIGADYDFGMVKIYGTYQNRDTDTAAGVKLANNGDKWAVGASIPVFKVGSILLSYGDFDSDVTGMDMDAWTIAYTHSLSKRTTLYAGYSDVNNSRLNAGSAAASSASPRTGGDASMLAFGMRHSF